MNIRENLSDAGFENVIYLNSIYDNALIGVSSNYNAIYDYEKMISCLMDEDTTDEDAVDWIDYNVINTLPHTEYGENCPIIMYSRDWLAI